MNSLQEIQEKYKDINPTPLFDIVRDLDLTVYATDEFAQHQSGSICNEDGRFVIYVNALHPKTRQLFTIAHEIGHYILHRDLLTSEHIDTVEQPINNGHPALHRTHKTQYNVNEQEMEIEANEFAAELLMPQDFFVKKWEESCSIDEVAEYFGVSQSAVALRAKKLLGVTMM